MMLKLKKAITNSIMKHISKKFENEMDIRVESMISEIHNYRDHYRLQLDKYKMEFQKYCLIILEIKY